MRWVIAGTHSLDSDLRVCTAWLTEGLARRGHQVLYLPAPISPWHSLVRKTEARFQERRKVSGHKPVAHPDLPILQYTPTTWLPVLRQGSFDNSWIMQNSLNATRPSLRKVLQNSGFDQPDVLMLVNLQYANLDRLIQPKKAVYRCVDDIACFAHAPRVLKKAESELLQRVDSCHATSHHLANLMRERGAKNSVPVIHHGVDIKRFAATNLPEPKDLRDIPHPRAIYVGALDVWFHQSWLRAAAKKLPQMHFVLIGPQAWHHNELDNIDNIHLLGPRPAETIPNYLQHCDLGLIPFQPGPLIDAVCPMKLYEYLAAGLPVVASFWNELEQIAGPISLAKTSQEFIAHLQQAQHTGSSEERFAWAKERNWDARVEQLLNTL